MCRAQVGHLGLRRGLDAEQVAPTLGMGDGGDQRDLEGMVWSGSAVSTGSPRWPTFQVGDVALGLPAAHDAVGVPSSAISNWLWPLRTAPPSCYEIAMTISPAKGARHLGLAIMDSDSRRWASACWLWARAIWIWARLRWASASLACWLYWFWLDQREARAATPSRPGWRGVALLHHLPARSLGRGDRNRRRARRSTGAPGLRKVASPLIRKSPVANTANSSAPPVRAAQRRPRGAARAGDAKPPPASPRRWCSRRSGGAVTRAWPGMASSALARHLSLGRRPHPRTIRR